MQKRYQYSQIILIALVALITFSVKGCGGPLSAFTKLTISASNFSYANSATNDNLTMNLTMTFSNVAFSGNELTSATIAITGAVSGSVSGEPVNIECDDYRMTFSSIASGETVSVSGRIKPSCLGGWVTITTNTPLFIPIGALCPTAGEVVALSGANSVKVVIASDSKITIYFNDSLVTTYNNCKDVDGLCVG